MTVKQQQCLLCYMGLYKGEIDGKFGPQSKEATRQAQKQLGIGVDGVFGPITEKTIIAHIAGKDKPTNNQLYNAIITCIDAIEDLPEFKTLAGLLEE